jgi:hypothetical protein
LWNPEFHTNVGASSRTQAGAVCATEEGNLVSRFGTIGDVHDHVIVSPNELGPATQLRPNEPVTENAGRPSLSSKKKRMVQARG